MEIASAGYIQCLDTGKTQRERERERERERLKKQKNVPNAHP